MQPRTHEATRQTHKHTHTRARALRRLVFQVHNSRSRTLQAYRTRKVGHHSLARAAERAEIAIISLTLSARSRRPHIRGGREGECRVLLMFLPLLTRRLTTACRLPGALSWKRFKLQQKTRTVSINDSNSSNHTFNNQ